MPRLNHKKARTGCARCKTRKVKCDEAKPNCTACSRHNVPCQYTSLSSGIVERKHVPTRPETSNGHETSSGDGERLDHQLEVRLMHEWTVYTCKTFTPAWEFWQYQAPLIAFEYRYVMDAILALAALHSSRQTPRKWLSLEGRMVPIEDPSCESEEMTKNLSRLWKLSPEQIDGYREALTIDIAHEKDAWTTLSQRCRMHMVTTSRMYFDRAIDGHRKALANLTVENIEAAYITSILVSCHALFTLSASEDDPDSLSLDPVLWIRLAYGTRMISKNWRDLMGYGWMASSGVFYGKPDLSDEAGLFDEEHSHTFRELLTWGDANPKMTEDDRVTYQQAISYIGVMYKGVVNGSDLPLGTSRRLVALPSRLPDRFVELAEQRQPRALVIIAHAFAIMKLVEDRVLWFENIADQQLPLIGAQLPTNWKPLMKWPMAVLAGGVEKRPEEYRGHLM